MKGKHGQAAAVRHEVQSRDAEIALLRHENERLAGELLEARTLTEDFRRKLGAWTAEDVARFDRAVQDKVDTLLQQHGFRAGRNEGISTSNRKIGGVLLAHFMDEHGMDTDEAAAAVRAALSRAPGRAAIRAVSR